MPTKKIIDLLKVTKIDTMLLKKLFENLKPGDILKKDTPYGVLSHSVFCRERHSTKTPDKPKEGLRYEVIGELLGKGSFAEVFDIKTTLALLPNGNIVAGKKPRVLKVSTDDKMELSNREGEYQHAAHLHAKPAVTNENNEKYYSVMHKMPDLATVF